MLICKRTIKNQRQTLSSLTIIFQCSLNKLDSNNSTVAFQKVRKYAIIIFYINVVFMQ